MFLPLRLRLVQRLNVDDVEPDDDDDGVRWVQAMPLE
jgi:hypothetical protein